MTRGKSYTQFSWLLCAEINSKICVSNRFNHRISSFDEGFTQDIRMRLIAIERERFNLFHGE